MICYNNDHPFAGQLRFFKSLIAFGIALLVLEECNTFVAILILYKLEYPSFTNAGRLRPVCWSSVCVCGFFSWQFCTEYILLFFINTVMNTPISKTSRELI